MGSETYNSGKPQGQRVLSRMFEVGDQPLPGHTLLGYLGEGGFGEVWKAQNPHRIEIALKIVRIQGKQGLREVLAIRQLRNVRHPNLIPIFGFWLKDQEGNILENASTESNTNFLMDGNYQFFLAMGLADRTLMDRLQECQKEGLSGIPLDELMQYMEESARALDFLNAPTHTMDKNQKSSIEHCDIKPQNILLVGGSVQICDFGLARVLQHGVKAQHTTSYSPQYVAPELLKRDQGPTRGTDQYSLAISYGQLRLGQLPFGDIGFAPAILTAHLQGMLDFGFLPQRERVVIKRATALSPADRYPSVKAFVDALKESMSSGTRTSRSTLGSRSGPLRPGVELIPGHLLEEMIGRGSFGEVWRASSAGGIKKALKIIRNLNMPSGRLEMRALELITQVRHPHLIHIEAYYLLDESGEPITEEARLGKDAPTADTLVIVSELAEGHLGRRLKEVMNQTGYGIPPEELFPYMQQVASALDRLNRQHDIIHRDVKPENILLVEGTAKLADFGLAKALEGSSTMISTRSIGMTPLYAAPELCQHRIEQSTDQYSLALTYYHLRTGQWATGSTTDIPELLQAHLYGQLEFEGLPDAEKAVLRRGSAMEPQERYPSCSAFIQSIGAALSGTVLPEGQFASRDMPTPPALAAATRYDMPGTATVKSDPRISLTKLPDDVVIVAEPVRPAWRPKKNRRVQAVAVLIVTVVCLLGVALYFGLSRPPPVNDADLLAQSAKLIQQQQYQAAAEPLQDLARRAAASSSQEFRNEAMLLTANYLQSPQSGDVDKDLFISTYREPAHAFFTEQAEKLRLRPKDVDWKRGVLLATLEDPKDPWLIAFQIENAFRSPPAEQKTLLQDAEPRLESLPPAALGTYGVYLKGITRARMNDQARAATLLQTLSPTSRDMEWESRRSEIAGVLLTSYTDQKKKLLDEKNWQKILGDHSRLQELSKAYDSLSVWSAPPAGKDDTFIRFFATSAGDLNPTQVQAALKLASDNKLLEIEPPNEAFNLAFVSHYTSLLKKSNAPAVELLPVEYRRITSLRASHPALPPRDSLTQLEEFITLIKPGEVSKLPPTTRQQAAQVATWHGRILLDNAFAAWAVEKGGLQKALADFELAISLVNDKASALAEYQLWQTLIWLEMDRRDWYKQLTSLETTPLPKKAQPLLPLLQAAKEMQSGQAVEAPQEAQKHFKHALTHYAAAIDGLKDDTELSGYPLNIARAGKSGAHHALAQSLEGAAQRENLEQAAALARVVINDPRAGPAEPRAQLALGNALESTSMLAGDGNTGAAQQAFTAAAERWKGQSLSARPLTNLGRMHALSRDAKQWDQAETELNNAINLVEEGDVACEANFWLARVYENKGRYDVAQTTYARAEKLATTSTYRDAARIGSFTLLLEAPVALPAQKTLAERIDKLKDALPGLATVDASRKNYAEHLRIRALQHLGNFSLLLAKFDTPRKDELINHARQQLEALSKETEGTAPFYAARLTAQINFQLGKDATALKDTEMGGKLEAHVKELATGQLKSKPFLQRALLDLADTRFEILYEGILKLNSELPENVKMADQVLRAVDKSDPQYLMLSGHAGLLRYGLLLYITRLRAEQKGEDSTIGELRDIRQKAINLLEEAVAGSPHHRYAWKWYYALCAMSPDAAKKEAYAGKCREALKTYSDGNAEQLTTQIEEGLKTLLKERKQP